MAELVARRGALVAALGRRIAEEEGAIAAGRAACDEAARALAGRTARLRELTAPLAEYDGLATEGGLLPVRGRTWEPDRALEARRRRLGQRAAALRGAVEARDEAERQEG